MELSYHHHSNFRISFSSQKFLLCLFALRFHLSKPQTKIIGDCLFFFKFAFLLVISQNELFSVQSFASDLFQLVYYFGSLFLLWQFLSMLQNVILLILPFFLKNSIYCMIYHLFVHSSVFGHLDYFNFGAVRSNAAMSTHIHVFVSHVFSSLLQRFQGVEFLGQMTSLCST